MGDIAELLSELVEEHGLAGAQVAVLANGEITDAAAGVLNIETGIEVTTDSVFQIGSITKVWTATLIWQLVNEGLVDIDLPVQHYLPDFRIKDEATITVRHLLSHTSGIEGDLFTDTGHNDDAVEKYVETLADASLVHPPGAHFSYCNSGFVVLGRIVEVLRGKPFNTVLRERLIDPQGLGNVATDVGEAILLRPAIGHLTSKEGLRRAPYWSAVSSTAPAGTHLAMSARDLLGFVRMHLEADEFDAMREPQIELPDLGRVSGHWALGWMLPDYGGPLVLGHGGTTVGQSAFLRVVPEAGVAIAVLTNGGPSAPVFHALGSYVLQEFAGVSTPPPPVPPAEPLPVPDDVLGTYETPWHHLHVTRDEDGRTWLAHEPRTEFAKTALADTEPEEVVLLREDTVISARPDHGTYWVRAVQRDESGQVRYLNYTRAAVKIGRP